MEEKRLLSFPGAGGPGFPFLPSWVAPMWWVQMENLLEAAFGLSQLLLKCSKSCLDDSTGHKAQKLGLITAQNLREYQKCSFRCQSENNTPQTWVFVFHRISTPQTVATIPMFSGIPLANLSCFHFQQVIKGEQWQATSWQYLFKFQTRTHWCLQAEE